MSTKTTVVMGDIHGRFEWAEYGYMRIADNHDIDLLIQVGDFGFWPLRGEPWTLELNHPAVFVDGNHENHEVLQSEEFGELSEEWRECLEIWDYKSRGSIENGILYIGGAASIDRKQRTPGRDWFPEENIQYRDKLQTMENIREYDGNIHMVISHECPAGFDVSGSAHRRERKDDSNRRFLQEVLKETEPERWFFGHYHESMEGTYGETSWRCLDMIRKGKVQQDHVVIELPQE